MTKISYFTAIIFLLLISCSQKEERAKNIDSITESNVAEDKIVYHAVSDPKTNINILQIPLPATWKMATGGSAMYTGPNGIVVHYFPMKTFVNTTDQYMLQAYQQGGVTTREFAEIEEIIHQDLKPIATKEGSKYVGYYMVPELAETDRSVDAMMYKVAPMKQVFRAAVSEWVDAKGKPYALIIHQNGTFMNTDTNWSYYCHALEASAEDYQKAKETLLYGLINSKYNPRYFDSYNQQEANKANASWAAHNSKMQAQQQQFDSWQKNHRETTAAINDASMSSYNSRNAASDRNHNRFMNYIKDENTVTTATTGQRYQVQAGSQQYYMNENGEYVGSNNPNYDPNRDPNINNQTWEETQVEE